MEISELSGYNNDTVDFDIVKYCSDNTTVLDEVPDIDRFVSLEDWLEIDDIEYMKY